MSYVVKIEPSIYLAQIPIGPIEKPNLAVNIGVMK